MMRFAAFTVVLFFIFSIWTDADARKRKKKKKKSYGEESVMLSGEKEKFDEKFIYKKKYENRRQAGVSMFIFNEDGIPDENGKVETTNFFGVGFVGRFDLSETWTFIPRLAYSVFDKSKVFNNHTRDLSFGFAEADVMLRLSSEKNILEVFFGGGPQLRYRRYAISYSIHQVETGISTTDNDFKVGVGGGILALYNTTKSLSVFLSGRYYVINPDMTYTIQMGALISF